MTTPASQALTKLVEDIWEDTLESAPTYATMLGDHRYDDRLGDVSEEARQKDLAQTRAFLERVKQIDLDALDEEERITADIVRHDLESGLEGAAFDFHKSSVDQLSGIQVSFPTLLQNFHPKKTHKDWENLITRMKALDKRIFDSCRNLAAGAREGHKVPRVVLERVIGQIDDMLAVPVADSVYAKLADKIPESFSDRAELQRELLATAEAFVYPAFKRLRMTLAEDCLPVARENTGLWDNKNGLAAYAYMVKMHLGKAMDPQEIHEIGKRELARIHADMDKIAASQGKTRDEYAIFLSKDPSNFHQSKDALVAEYQALIEKAEARLPELFTKLPKCKCVARAIEEYREKDAPTGFYNPPPSDFSRPGLFYANTYQPETRMRSNMACLAYHEAVPGHHLQIALAMELELPEIRKHGRNTAYVEGWALYTERLCDEIGLYDSPADRFGMLGYQAWRAARLVIDTGLHAMKWSREQAIKEMSKATVLPESEVVNEIDRYLIMPGQALSYKIGELEIGRLRSDAESRLGKAFDLRAFHDRLLASGALPLDTLAMVMDRWVKSRAA